MDLLSTEQVSEMLGLSCSTLAFWRTKNTGPEYIKLGKRVRYTPQSVQAFIESKTVITSRL